jgi:6-phosphogluconate dehydrogenase
MPLLPASTIPCVTYIGPGASGHFVKMVHNGIEYGLMQLIAETYHELLHKGLNLNAGDRCLVIT